MNKQLQNESMNFVYCFNPNCPDYSNRVFSLRDDKLLQHQLKCSKWMLNRSDIEILQLSQPAFTNSEREELKLATAPLSQLSYFFKLNEHLKQRLIGIYDGVKKQLNACIEQCKAMKLIQLSSINDELTSFKNVILQSISSISKNDRNQNQYSSQMSWKINDVMRRANIQMDIFKDYLIFDQKQLMRTENKLKQQIISISNTFCQEMNIEGQFQGLKNRDLIQVQKMFDEPCQNYAERIKRLTNWESYQVFVSNSQKVQLLQCPICPFKTTVSAIIKHSKDSQIYRQFGKHLLSQHLFFLAMNYAYKISKNSVVQLPYSEIIYLMKSSNYKYLQIFDGTNKMPTIIQKPNTLSILFIGPETVKYELECKYTVIDSAEDAAFVMILLLQQVCHKMDKSMKIINFKRNYYNLYSKVISSLKLNAKIEDQRQIKKDVGKTAKIEFLN